jgi:hypothetical protein
MTERGNGGTYTVINTQNPEANMYGCTPCPRCLDECRYPTARGVVLMVYCGECGRLENAVYAPSMFDESGEFVLPSARSSEE